MQAASDGLSMYQLTVTATRRENLTRVFVALKKLPALFISSRQRNAPTRLFVSFYDCLVILFVRRPRHWKNIIRLGSPNVFRNAFLEYRFSLDLLRCAKIKHYGNVYSLGNAWNIVIFGKAEISSYNVFQWCLRLSNKSCHFRDSELTSLKHVRFRLSK